MFLSPEKYNEDTIIGGWTIEANKDVLLAYYDEEKNDLGLIINDDKLYNVGGSSSTMFDLVEYNDTIKNIVESAVKSEG